MRTSLGSLVEDATADYAPIVLFLQRYLCPRHNAVGLHLGTNTSG